MTRARILLAAAAAACCWWISARWPHLFWAAAGAGMYVLLATGRGTRLVHRVLGHVRPAWARPRLLIRGRAPGWWGGVLAWRAARRLRRDWPALIDRAGWGKSGHVPVLVNVRRRGDAVEVVWRPLPADKERTWEQDAHTIRRWLGAPTVRTWIDPSDSGISHARIGLRKLPTRVELGQPPAGAGVGRAAAFWLGPAAGGGDAYWLPYHRAHIGIFGETRGGKGGTARLLLAQACGRGWNVTIVNPKASGEFEWTREHRAVVATTPDEVLAALTAAEEGRRAVQDRIRSRGLDDWTYLPDPERPDPHLVLIDEASEQMDGTDRTVERIADLVVTLARMGASAGVHLVVLAQRPDVANGALGKRGGALRAQLGARVAVGSMDPAGLRMALRRVDTDTAVGLPEIRGRALVTGLDAGSAGDVYGVQVAWLPPDVVNRQVSVVDAVAAGGAGDAAPPTGVRDGHMDTPAATMDTADTGLVAGDAAGAGPESSWTSPADPADGRVAEPGPGASGDVAGPGGAPGAAGGPVPVQVAAARLGRSERTVRRWAHDPLDGRVTWAGPGMVHLHDPGAP